MAACLIAEQVDFDFMFHSVLQKFYDIAFEGNGLANTVVLSISSLLEASAAVSATELTQPWE